MHTEGHDPGRPSGTSPHPPATRDSEHPGYETQDVNVSGILVFLSGLFGFVLVFFVVCFALGKLINGSLMKEYGEPRKWAARSAFDGAAANNGKREDLTSNAEMQRRLSEQVQTQFPAPMLESDDGMQDTSDLHAREDLLLDHYSTIDGQPGAVRIPIGRAMELIAQRGLPLAAGANQANAAEHMTGDGSNAVQVPLTSGFARTGYEQKQIQGREQKMMIAREGAEHESAGAR